ncbi:hypothetical protein F511_08468 [Dorcoceras hygrometricum]|uniref:Uncharacterized protein n=1 Tax=Dorcoceras hygrometricum TaxID=472368 RepID=A0A2Z7ABF0_9LAMI|nr:hypothetical protein F511_08468 [Dorcoceras hygrometricum]
MFPLKLVRSIVFGDNNISSNPLLLSQNHRFLQNANLDDNGDDPSNTTISAHSRNRIPLMLFVPTQELVKDTYRLAKIARDIGMDLNFNPSISHVIFSWPSPSPSPPTSSQSSSSSSSSSCASTSSSSSHCWSLANDSVPLPFPSFTTASLSHLRLLANLSKGCFKLVFLKNGCGPIEKVESLSNNNWHCTSLSLIFTRTGEKIESMAGFSKALLGMGWTLFKTHNNGNASQDSLNREVYLYRKTDLNRLCIARQLASVNGDFRESCRVRELRLPMLDFRNAPLRILQYILLMTDDVFYLA